MKYKMSIEMEKAHLLNLYEDIFFFMSKMDKKFNKRYLYLVGGSMMILQKLKEN